MPRFKTKSHVTHDGKEYEAGAIVDMSEKQAAAIPWAVDAVQVVQESRRVSEKVDDKADKK